MDDLVEQQVTLTEEWCTIAASVVLCGISTIVYLLCDFQEHEPLFYVFLWLSLFVLVAEYGDRFFVRAFGQPVVSKLRKSGQLSNLALCRGLEYLVELRRDQRTTFFWVVNCFFIVIFCVSRQMDDASLVYAACMLLSSSPLIRKLLGHSTRELANRAAHLFQPPQSEPAELAEYMPHINEVSRDFSIRVRRNSMDMENSVIDPEMDISVFDAAGLRSLDASAVSLMHESHFAPEMEESPANSSKATDDDSSPIPSDVEIIEADDIPEDLPPYDSIKSGRFTSKSGAYTKTGTLRRRHSSDEEEELVG